MPRGGKTRTSGQGRPKGAKNKLTRSAKEAYAFAFEELGGGEGLRDWARLNPENLREFYRLHARLIPIEMTGKDGDALIPSTIRVELVAPDE